MPAPWKTLSSRTVLRDRWIDLRADDCETPGGQPVAPYYVLRYPDFVHVVAVTDAQELVLVELYRHAAGAVMLELPGGMMDDGDADPVAAGLRELLEETGYAGTAPRLLSSLFVNPATHTNRNHCVLVTGCTRIAPPRLEAGEDGMQVRLMPVADARAAARAGGFGQSMQVGGLLLALEMLSAAGQV